jgi:hypothetical protein
LWSGHKEERTANLSQDARNRLLADSNLSKQFPYAAIKTAEEANGGTLKNLPDKALRRAIEKAVRETAGAFELELTPPPSPIETTKTAYPLGILATDHAGYLSFDLTRLPEDVYQSLVNAVDLHRQDRNAVLDTSVWFYGLAREELRFDALVQVRFAKDTIYTKLELDTSFRVPPIARAAGFLSMQNPSLTDWRLSPASFAANPSALLGDEEGCENLLPANVALRDYRLYQVTRFTDAQPAVPHELAESLRLGIVHEYRVRWYPLGHSLGQILYSLPLAPGESVNLAVVDWTRRDDAQRKEQTKLDEQIVHREHRDRIIDETVTAAIKEYQHGSSFMGGAASSGGLSADVSSGIGIAAGLASSLGGSTATSDGSREIAGTTVQNVSDNISQASVAARELQSTVVVHAVQTEREAIETRTVVNYNHSHALTILYYEVLRHFRVVTQFVRRRPALLVKVPDKWLQESNVEEIIRENRAALESVIFNARFADGFNALERIAHRQALAGEPPGGPPLNPPGPAGPLLRFFKFELKTGQMWLDHTGEGLTIKATLYPGGQRLGQGDHVLNPPGAFVHENAVNHFMGTLPSGTTSVPLDDIDLILFEFTLTGGADVAFQSIKVVSIDVNGNPHTLIDEDYSGGHLVLNATCSFGIPTLPRPALPPPLPRPSEELEDEAKKTELIDHLKYHSSYYSRALLLAENPDARARELQNLKFVDGSSVLDRLDNTPLAAIGDFVAYPCTDESLSANIHELLANKLVEEVDERLVSLPTRGVFAEAKLSHCNASEWIDPNRF